jgi:hypothetical protein
MKKLLLIGFILLLTGCTSEVSDIEHGEIDINEVSDKLSELQKQIEELKTENEELKKEEAGFQFDLDAATLDTPINKPARIKTVVSEEETKKVLECGNGYALSLDKTYCVEIPQRAHAVNSNTGVWACDSGFFERDNQCFRIAQDPEIRVLAIRQEEESFIPPPKETLVEEVVEKVIEKETMVEVILTRCMAETSRFSYYEPGFKSAVNRCDFQIIFNHPDTVYTVNLNKVIWKTRDYAPEISCQYRSDPYILTPHDFDVIQTFSGKDGDVENGSAWFVVSPCPSNQMQIPVLKNGKIVETLTFSSDW